jgi:transcriptional regulator with XRE-family HTH domain
VGFININIKTARKKAGLTQDQIAKRLKKPRTTYASWEDNIDPSLDDLNHIAKIVGISLQDLLTENSENIDKIKAVPTEEVGNGSNGKGESDRITLLERALSRSLEQIQQLQNSLDVALQRQQVIAAMTDASLEALLFDMADRKKLARGEVKRSVRNRAFSKLHHFEANGIVVEAYM